MPASFRLAIAGQSFKELLFFRSYKLPTVEGMGIERMQQLSNSVDQLDLFSEAQDDLTATILQMPRCLHLMVMGVLFYSKPCLSMQK